MLTDIDQNSAEADNTRRNEQTLRRMQETGSERLRVQVKPRGNHSDVENEKDNVEEEEEDADGV